MGLITFSPYQPIRSSEINENFGKLETGEGIDWSAQNQAWVAPTLLNSWANYSTTFSEAGYFKDKNGMVHLRGLVKDGTASAGTAIFTLPTGYRPTRRLIIVTVSSAGHSQLRVDTDGDVQFYAGANTWFSLDGVSFRGDQ